MQPNLNASSPRPGSCFGLIRRSRSSDDIERRSTRGVEYASSQVMFNRTMVMLLLVGALILTSFASPAWSCTMKGQPQDQPMTCGGSCCAAMKCCTPAAPGPRTPQASASKATCKDVVAAVAPVPTTPRSALFAREDYVIPVARTCQQHVISPLAASCIRLI